MALPAGAVHACTDITGFGLLGHAVEMAEASGCTLRLIAGAVPLIDGARELALGNTPGGGWNNEQHFGGRIRTEGHVEPDVWRVLFDPQTSGGLLVAIDAAHEEAAKRGLQESGSLAAVIGAAAAHSGSRLVLVP